MVPRGSEPPIVNQGRARGPAAALFGPAGGEFVGLYVFTVPPDDVRTIMDADPAYTAQIFTYEVMTFYGFPGDGLPPA